MKNLFICIIYASIFSISAKASVIDSSFHGFTIKQTIIVQSSSSKVYDNFTRNIIQWWDLDHTFSGKPKTLEIETTQGGFWREVFPSGGQATWGMVVYSDPGKLLRLNGTQGPFQSFAASQSTTISFATINQGTEVTVTIALSGYSVSGMGIFAKDVDRVWGEALERFKEYQEKHP